MATTYSRINTLLQKAKNEDKWIDIESFIKNFRKRKLKDFKVRGDGTSIDDYMSEESVKKLIELIADFELIEIKSDQGQFSLLDKGRRCLIDDENYNINIQSSIKSYLEKKSLPIETIKEKMKKIKLPDVPDADTIFNQFQSIDHHITKELLRKLLFLYACADGIKRKTRVHYVEK